MGLNKLSKIVNGFFLRWLLIPAVFFIILFSLLYFFSQIINVKKLQSNYADNLRYHVVEYLNRCKNDIEHIEAHISKSHDKNHGTGVHELIDSKFLFHTVYLLDRDYTVIKSFPKKYLKHDFSGLIKKNIYDYSILITAPYYSFYVKKVVIGMAKKSKNGMVIFAELNLSTLEKYIKGVTQYINNGSVFLTDSYGNLISHVDMQLVKRQENLGNIALFEDLKKEDPVSGFYWFDNRLKLMSASNVSFANWMVVIEQDALAISFPIILSTIIMLIGINVSILLVIFLFNKKLSDSVVKPVSKFSRDVSLLSREYFFLKNLDNTKRYKDEHFAELEDLYNEFYKMQNAIVNRETLLKESEERYRTIVEDTPILICSYLDDGEITFVNKAYCEYFNKTSDELIGMKFTNLLPESDRQKVMDNIATLTPESPVFEIEHRVIDAKGKIRWQRWTDRALFNDKGKLINFQAIGEDITKRKESQEKLADERERLSVTLKSIGDGVITTDIEGRVVLLNKVAEEVTGWSNKEAQGLKLSTVFNIIREDTREIHENPVEKVLSSGSIVELANNTILIARDGKERIIADSGAPIKDKNNKIIGVVLVFRDVTEKKKMNDALERTARLESLGLLAGGIAHDFNNLLGGVFGYVDLALTFSKDDDVKEFLNKSLEAMERAKSLTGQLLTFSKGGAPVKVTKKLFPFLKDTVDFALSGSNVTCEIEASKDLMHCNFDQNQLSQVVDNIVINAKQAMKDGGKIELKAENIFFDENSHLILDKGNYIKISIKDHGKGILTENLPRIFDPFFSTKNRGHGIGLTTSYSIIEKHGGCIDVNSIYGKGSEFIIYLPAINDNSSCNCSIESKDNKKLDTIIIMDDDDIILDMTSAMLKSMKFKVLTAKNGNDALTLFRENQNSISAIICDLTIQGGKGGKETVKEIRAIDGSIPVFVASGYSEDPVMASPTDYGFSASIPKPFKSKELKSKLRIFLEF